MTQPLRVDQMDDLDPKIRAGLTEDEDQNIEQIEKMVSPSGDEVIARTQRVEYLPGTRVPIAQFVATDDDDTIWVDASGERVQRGAILSFAPETVDAIRAGHICLRCLESTPDAFPLKCDLCGFAMRELQAVAFATEFEGETHLGPSRPIQAYADALEEERLRNEHEKKIAQGASLMRGLKHGA